MNYNKAAFIASWLIAAVSFVAYHTQGPPEGIFWAVYAVALNTTRLYHN